MNYIPGSIFYAAVELSISRLKKAVGGCEHLLLSVSRCTTLVYFGLFCYVLAIVL